MEIEISSGDKKIISSGVFVTDNEENNISLKFGSGELYITFLFKDDKDIEPRKIKWMPKKDNKGLIMEFINFNNKLGDTSIEPLVLATIHDKIVSLKLQIKSFNEKTKIVTYTFYTQTKNG